MRRRTLKTLAKALRVSSCAESVAMALRSLPLPQVMLESLPVEPGEILHSPSLSLKAVQSIQRRLRCSGRRERLDALYEQSILSPIGTN